MRAHHVVEHSGPAALVLAEIAEPEADGLVLIDVRAAGVSFADLLQTRGHYQLKPLFPYAPGMDAAGVVLGAPPDAGLEIGQRVAVLVRYGTWQEVIAVPRDAVLPLAEDLDFVDAVALSLNYVTALFALTIRGAAAAGETLVVHGAAGGVGVAALDVGRALGLRTIGVVSDARKREVALASGATDCVLAENWLADVTALLGGRAVDLVLDPVGGDRVTDSLRSLRPGGRMVVVGFAAGDVPSVKLNRLLLGNIAVVGAASLEYFEQRPHVMRELWDQILLLRDAGKLGTPAVRTFPFEDAEGALQAIAARQAMGKVVLVRPAPADREP
ncbi:MAG: NADPH:quinone oxidoreductase family protein [Acidimicrobiia bacterium]